MDSACRFRVYKKLQIVLSKMNCSAAIAAEDKNGTSFEKKKYKKSFSKASFHFSGARPSHACCLTQHCTWHTPFYVADDETNQVMWVTWLLTDCLRTLPPGLAPVVDLGNPAPGQVCKVLCVLFSGVIRIALFLTSSLESVLLVHPSTQAPWPW